MITPYHETHLSPCLWVVHNQQKIMDELVLALRDNRGRNVLVLQPIRRVAEQNQRVSYSRCTYYSTHGGNCPMCNTEVAAGADHACEKQFKSGPAKVLR